MNYKGFKKVHDDDEKAILKNDRGHSITISKKALTSRLANDLKNLPLHAAEGVDVPPADDRGPASAPPTSEEMTPENATQQPGAPDTTQDAQSDTEPAQVSPAPTVVQDAQQQTAGDPTAQKAQELTNEDQKWSQDLANGHITPETYHSLFAKKDTLGKIGSVFGLLLSGAGSGLAHQPNAALAVMNQQIQNDLEAQKNSKENAMNFLRLNQQHQLQKAQIGQMGAQTALTQAEANTKANALAQIQMNRTALHSLVMHAQKLPVGSPQRQQADAALAMLSQQVNTENFRIADRAAVASTLSGAITQNAGNQSNPEQSFQQTDRALRLSGNAPIAEDMEAKHYPGLQGQASKPITGSDKEMLDSGFQFQQQLQKFTDWTKKHSGDLNPAEINEGRAMAADLQGAYRQATHGGVYKEGEQNFISKLIDQNPTKFFNSIRVVPQLNALAKINADRIDQTAKNLGFKGYQMPQQKYPEVKEGTTGVHNGRNVIFRNGKWSYR